MTDTRGTFRLHTVRQNVLNNEYVPVPNVWLLQDDIAHSRPYPVSNLQRWNLGNSTMSNSTLSCSRYWGQASGNTTVSYFAGGGVSPGITGKTNTDKLSYSPYTLAATPTANLTNAISRGGASSSNLAAYFSTGYPTGSWVDKILFATDTKSTLSDDFGTNYMTFSSLADGAGGGYLFEANVSQSKTFKITYSTDGISHLPGSNLVNYTTESNGEMMSRTAGYKSGGAASSPAASSLTNKLSYSNTTWSAVPGGKLPIAKRRAASGTGRSKGFVGGGDLNVAPVYTDFAMLDFSTDTYAQEPSLNFSVSNYGYYPNKSTTTPLDGLYGADKATDRSSFWSDDNSKRWFDSAGPSPNFGVFAGAGEAEDGSSLDKLDYSTETMSNAGSLSPGPNTEQINRLSGGSSATNGYITTGQRNSAGNASYIWKHTYSTATTAVNPANLGSTGEKGVGLDDSTTTYITNLKAASPSSRSVWKIVHADDTTAEVPGLIRTWGTEDTSSSLAVSNITAGSAYITGGSNPSVPARYSWTEKITFSSNTRSRLPAANYPISVSSGTAVGGPSDGYFGTGYASPSYHSTLYKLTYSSGTFSTVGNLAGTGGSDGYENEQKGSLGSTLSGYFFAGALDGNRRGSDVDKFVYSTDTISTLSGIMIDCGQPAPFKYIRGIGCTGGVSVRQNNRPNIADVPTATPTASTFPSLNPALNVNAVFASGQSPSATVNTRSKFTFSNETMASMPAFSDKITVCGGASSTTRGYLSGGFGNTSQGDTQNKRWYNQYSNDTSATLPSRTSQNAGGMYSMNDETKLYSGGGGWSGGQYNTAESMPFANETNTGEPGMTLTSPKKYASGIGNKTIGFVCGGNENNNNRTTIDKVVYSTGTMSTSPSNLTLSGASPYHATMAMGNTTTGFIFQSSPTNKLVFATETVSSAPNNNTATSWGNATSSATTGYCMNYPSGQYLIKYVFSTETTGTLPSMFSPNKSRGGAMSTAMFGGAYTSTPNLI